MKGNLLHRFRDREQKEQRIWDKKLQLLPLAFTSFKLVSEKLKSSEISNHELCSQLSKKLKIHQRLQEEQVPSRTAQRKYSVYDKM